MKFARRFAPSGMKKGEWVKVERATVSNAGLGRSGILVMTTACNLKVHILYH